MMRCGRRGGVRVTRGSRGEKGMATSFVCACFSDFFFIYFLSIGEPSCVWTLGSGLWHCVVGAWRSGGENFGGISRTQPGLPQASLY
jgi:hypothetical protein